MVGGPEVLPTEEYPALEYLGTKTSTGQLAFRDPDGLKDNLFVPEFNIREDPVNIEAFVIYERTFGRRNMKAFSITHADMAKSGLHPKMIAGEYKVSLDVVEEIHAAWVPFASKVAKVLMSENQNEVRVFMEEMAEFRRKYSWLYTKPPRKKFVVKDETPPP